MNHSLLNSLGLMTSVHWVDIHSVASTIWKHIGEDGKMKKVGVNMYTSKLTVGSYFNVFSKGM